MANLTPQDSFDAVYRLTRHDKVDAGVNGEGPANKQAQQLLNRTQHLKIQQDQQATQLQAEANARQAADTTLQQQFDSLGTAKDHDAKEFATAAQGEKADNAIPASEKGFPGGVATLNAQGLLPEAMLPALAIGEVFTVDSEAAQITLDAQSGDWCVRTDADNQMYVRNSGTDGAMSDWTALKVKMPISADAPDDGKQYVRQSGTWSALEMAAPQVEVTASRELMASDNNAILICTGVAPIILTFSASLPDGFSCLILCTAGRVHISDLGKPLNQGGNNTLTTEGNSASFVSLRVGANTSWLSGSLDAALDVFQLQDGTPLQRQDNSPLELTA